MAINYPSQGEGYTGAYQISATPWVTSSTVALGETKEFKFGSITRFFAIQNTGAASSVIAVGFTERGLLPVNANFFTLSGSASFAAELRTDRLFVSGSSGSPSFTIVAGLTTIPDKNLTPITGSNGFPGVG